jgi:hypothetical protein
MFLSLLGDGLRQRIASGGPGDHGATIGASRSGRGPLRKQDRHGVQPEALAAIGIFCEAARREAATVELARRVIRFLDRSQHDPELKFEEVEVP